MHGSYNAFLPCFVTLVVLYCHGKLILLITWMYQCGICGHPEDVQYLFTLPSDTMCNVLENKFTQLLADDSGVTFSVSYFIMWDETWLNPLLIVSRREVILVLVVMV